MFMVRVFIVTIAKELLLRLGVGIYTVKHSSLAILSSTMQVTTGVDPYGIGGTHPSQYLDQGTLSRMSPPPIFNNQSLGTVPFKKCASCSQPMFCHFVAIVKRRTVDCLFIKCIVCVYSRYWLSVSVWWIQIIHSRADDCLVYSPYNGDVH